MGLAYAINTGLGASGQYASSQMLRDQLATYPDLLKSQLLQQQVNTAIAQNTLNYAPQMSQQDLLKAQQYNQMYIPISQADIATKNAYATNAPYQASAMLSGDPIAQMAYDRSLMQRGYLNGPTGNSPMPPVISNNGGMTVAPAPSPGGLGAPLQNIPPPFSNGGVPYAQPGANAPMMSQQQAANYQTLPGGAPPGSGQQLSSGPSGMAGAPVQMPDYDTLMALKMRQMMAVAGKNPMMGNSRGGQGGTYTDPTTGQIVSSDTSKNTTLDQQTSASIQRVQPLLKQLSDNITPFLTASGDVGLKGSQYSNYILGTQFGAPAQYAKAEQALNFAPEGLMRVWGLNITDQSAKIMQDAVKPQFGESPQQYTDRVTDTMKMLDTIQKEAESRLAGGMPVGNVNAQPQSAAAQTPKYSDEDIAYTAQKRGLSVAEVKKRLGVQ